MLQVPIVRGIRVETRHLSTGLEACEHSGVKQTSSIAFMEPVYFAEVTGILLNCSIDV